MQDSNSTQADKHFSFSSLTLSLGLFAWWKETVWCLVSFTLCTYHSPTSHCHTHDLHSAILHSFTVIAIEQWNVFVPLFEGKPGLPAAMVQLSPPWKCYYKCSLPPSNVGNAAGQWNEQDCSKRWHSFTRWHSWNPLCIIESSS